MSWRKADFKKISWFTSGLVLATGLPLAVAASCGTSDGGTDNPIAVEVKINGGDLGKVVLQGSTQNLSFTVPDELVKVDPSGALSAQGGVVAFDIFGRVTIPNLAGQGITNTTFMPLRLLSYYLGGKLEFVNNVLVANDNGQTINVADTFGKSVWGFDATNHKPTLVGLWDANLIEVKYFARAGFSAAQAELDKVGKPNITNLKSYVNLDLTWTSNTDEYLAFSLQSTHDAVVWTKTLTRDSIAAWTPYVAPFKWSLTPAGATTTTLPTSFPYQSTERNLYLNVEPASLLYELSTSQVDLTLASHVSRILTKIDAYTVRDPITNVDTTFASNAMNKVVLGVKDNKIFFDTSVLVVPDGALLRFRFADDLAQSWTSVEVLAKLQAEKPTSVAPITGFFISADPNKYLIIDDKVGTISMPFKGFLDTSAFFESAQHLQIDLATSVFNSATSEYTSLAFVGAPLTISSEIAKGVSKAQYLLTLSPDLTEASVSTKWIDSLPTSGASGSYFFVRLVSNDSYVLSQLIDDLTDTSNFGGVLPQVTPSFITEINLALEALQVETSTSRHSNVTWKKAFALTPAQSEQVLAVEFLSGFYTTKAEIDSASAWSTTLPTTLLADHSQRHIHARIRPKPGFRVENRTIDLTTTSQVQAVLTQIDDLPSYQALDLEKIVLSGGLSQLQINASLITLPVGTGLEWAVDTQAFGTEVAMRDFLRARSTSITAEQVLSMRVRLTNLDATKYALTNVKISKPDTAAIVLGKNIAIPEALNLQLQGIKVTSGSTPQNVTWTTFAQPTFEGLEHIEFLSGNYTSRDAASLVTSFWTTTLPTTVLVDPSSRFLWARLITKPDYAFTTDVYFDLSESSSIRTLLTNITEQAQTFKDAALQIAPTTSSNHAQVSWTLPSALTQLSQYMTYEYFYSPTIATLAEAQSETWSSTLPTSVSTQHAQRHLFMRAHLRSGYVVDNGVILAVDISAIAQGIKTQIDIFTTFADLDLSLIKLSGSALFPVLDQSLVTLPEGTRLVFKFAGETTSLSSTDLIARLKTSAGSWTQSEIDGLRVELQLVDAAKWALTDVKVADFNKSLFALLAETSLPAAFTTALADLKWLPSSNSLAITWDVDLAALLASAPTLASMEFLSGNFTATEVAASTSWVANLPTAVAVDPDQRGLFALFKPKVGYELIDEAILDLTASSKIKDLRVDVTSQFNQVSNLMSDFEDSIFAATSVHSSVAWNYIVLPSQFQAYFTVEYLYSETVTTSAEALSSLLWSATLPTTVSPIHNLRHLFVRLAPKIGYVTTHTTTEMVFNFSTRIQSIVTQIDDLPALQALDLKKVVLKGSIVNPSLDLAAITLPPATEVVYQINNGLWLTAENFLTFLSSLKATITTQQVATIKAQLKLLDSVKYVLHDLNTQLIDTTNLKLIEVLAVPAAVGVALPKLVVQAGSTPSAVLWNALDELPISVGAVEYLSGNYADLTAATAATDWTSFLPSAVALIPTDRHLWVRVQPAPGYQFLGETIFDITVSSGIQTLQTDATAAAEALAAQIEALSPTTGSNHTNVVWSNPIVTARAIAPFKISYLYSEVYASLAGIPASEVWSTSLPTQISSIHDERYLFVKLTPNPGFVTSATTAFDISSSIQTVHTLVDRLDGFSALDLALVRVSGPLFNATVDQSGINLVGLPLQLMFEIPGNASLLNPADLLQYLKTNRATLQPQDWAGIEAQLQVTDAIKYVLASAKKTVPDVSALTRTQSVAIPASLVTKLGEVAFTNSSSTTAITWNDFTFIDETVDKVEFLSGDYATPALAAAATTWGATLPPSVIFNPTSRHLWARVTPTSDYSFLTSALFDLTTSSRIQSLTINADAFLSSVNTYFQAFLPLATSVHSDVEWSPVSTATTFADVFDLTYLSSAASFTPAEARESLNWASTLPNAVSADFTKRYLYLWAKPKVGYSLTTTNDIIDLSLLLNAIPVQVDDLPTYAPLDLSLVDFSGSLRRAIVDESAITLPQGTTLQYQFDGKSFTKATLITYMHDNVATITQEMVNDLRVKLVLTNATQFVLNDDKQASPNTTRFSLDEQSSVSQVTRDALIDIKYLVGSFQEAVLWPTLPSWDPEVSYVEFLSGDFATDFEAMEATAWSRTLPTSVDFDTALRFLWARVVPIPGVVFTGRTIFDLSISSGIGGLLNNASASFAELVTGLKALSFSETSTHANVTWVYSNLISDLADKFTVSWLLSETQVAIENVTTASGWADTLPSQVNASKALRHVFARITLNDGYYVDSSVFYYDLSAVAKNIITSLDDLTGFDAIDLTKVTVSGSLLFPVVDTSAVTLVGNLQIVYALTAASGQTAWMNEADLVAYLKTNFLTLTFNHLSTITARLVNPDVVNYKLIDNREALVNSAALTLLEPIAAPTPLLSALNAIKFLEGSHSLAVTWSALPTLPTGIQGLEFLSGNFATAAAASAATSWANDLPSAVNINPVERYLWVRLIASPGYTITGDKLFDLTAATSVRSLVEDASTEAVSAQAELSAVQATSASTHNAVTWTGTTFSPALLSRFNVEYLSSTTITTVSAAHDATTWSIALPTSVDPVHAVRHLFVRLVLKPGYVTQPGTTLISEISNPARAIKTLVDALPAYSSVNLAQVTLTGALINASIADNLTLPSGTKLTYTVTGEAAPFTKASLVQYLSTRFSNGQATWTTADFARIRASLAITDATLFVLNNNKQAIVNTTNFKVLAPYSTAVIGDVLKTLRVSVTSSVNNITWIKPTLEIVAPLVRVEYLLSTAATELVASTATGWTETLPTSITFAQASATLFARFVVATGYEPTPIYLDLTTTSAVRTLLSVIPPAIVQGINLSGIVTANAGAVHNNATFTVNALPASATPYFKLSFLIGNFPSETSAQTSSLWSSTANLPTMLDYDASLRQNLWIRAESLPGFVTETVLYNASAVLSNVPSLIDAHPNFAGVDLSKLVIYSGASLSLVKTALSPLPLGTQLEFILTSQASSPTATWFTEAQFLTQAVATYKPGVKVDVRLAASSNKYVFSATSTRRKSTLTIQNYYKYVEDDSKWSKLKLSNLDIEVRNVIRVDKSGITDLPDGTALEYSAAAALTTWYTEAQFLALPASTITKKSKVRVRLKIVDTQYLFKTSNGALLTYITPDFLPPFVEFDPQCQALDLSLITFKIGVNLTLDKSRLSTIPSGVEIEYVLRNASGDKVLTEAALLASRRSEFSATTQLFARLKITNANLFAFETVSGNKQTQLTIVREANINWRYRFTITLPSILSFLSVGNITFTNASGAQLTSSDLVYVGASNANINSSQLSAFGSQFAAPGSGTSTWTVDSLVEITGYAISFQLDAALASIDYTSFVNSATSTIIKSFALTRGSATDPNISFASGVTTVTNYNNTQKTITFKMDW